tara:strand:+ start:4797 stop:5417 length:621 start_codon:yes stop_codon:yes gene_type:complete
MKRINYKTSGKSNFISAWQSENLSLMDQIIDLFEDEKKEHRTGAFGLNQTNKEFKNTTDISIRPNQLSQPKYAFLQNYISDIDIFYKDYRNQWEFFGKNIPILQAGTFNIQKYEIGGHVKRWHTERDSISNAHRILAWITYLNDVESEGETEFLYYDLKIKPEKGKTVIWPAEWTHSHRGNPTPSIKYCITGWFTLPSEEKIYSEE